VHARRSITLSLSSLRSRHIGVLDQPGQCQLSHLANIGVGEAPTTPHRQHGAIRCKYRSRFSTGTERAAPMTIFNW